MTDEELTLCTEAAYLGFIQAICWTTGADGNNPTIFNEPDEIWVHTSDGGDYYTWDRALFLRLFADFDSEASCMLLKLIAGPAWVVYSTESDDSPDFEERDELGVQSAGYWDAHPELWAGTPG